VHASAVRALHLRAFRESRPLLFIPPLATNSAAGSGHRGEHYSRCKLVRVRGGWIILFLGAWSFDLLGVEQCGLRARAAVRPDGASRLVCSNGSYATLCIVVFCSECGRPRA
jgi:hypothetical protein